MPARRSQEPPTPATEHQGCLSGILRLYWMAFGNLLLLFAAVSSAKEPSAMGRLGLFLFSVAALLAVRLIDIRAFAGQTSEGEPATMAHWRRYAIRLLVFSAVWRGLMGLLVAQGWI